MSLTATLRRRWDSLSGAKARRQDAAQVAFEMACAGLAPGDLAVDLGANAGDYTEKLADTGADVIAFEPDPHAFAALEARMDGRGRVTLVAAAAGEADGEMMLYRRTDFDRDPTRHSTSSSLIADKKKMAADGVTVKVVDIVAYLAALGRDIKVMKVDIEGAEVAVMEALLASPISARITQIFVETHERVIPRLAERTEALRAATRGKIAPQVNWDWH